MDPLRIELFGGLHLYRGDTLLPAFPTQKSRGLFAFLAVHRGRRHSRDVLLGRFWAESPQGVARKNLRTDIWRVRQVVEPPGVEPGSCICIQGDEVAFNGAGTAAHWLDVHEFEARLDAAGSDRGAGTDERAAALLRGAVALYRGDLLDGMYDDWCLFERERLRLRYIDALERLIRHHRAREEWMDAALHAQKLLAHDPLREHVHRELMRCYAALGDPAAALRQYDLCARLLAQELEVEPGDETVALRDEVRARQWMQEPAPRVPALTALPDLALAAEGERVLDRLRAAVRWVDEVGDQLRRAIRDLEAAPSQEVRECVSA